MKKRFFSFTLFLLICLSISPLSTAATVNIPDANLHAAVKKALGKKGAKITEAKMAKLTKLQAPKSKISDLTGLEYAINLKVLKLARNRITDISPLTGLTKLKELGLYKNHVANIRPLEHLTNLQQLNLRENNIADITPLVGNATNNGLGTGDTVDLRDNPLGTTAINTHIPTLQNRGVTVKSDVVNIPDANLRAKVEQALGKAPGAPIIKAEMATLTSLEAINANISNLTGLEWATNLTTLKFWGNDISDISAVAGLTNLTVLRVGNNGRNGVSDISAVAGLTNLTTLEFVYNGITDISPVAGLTNLTKLDLLGNDITNISAVSQLTNLTWLRIADNSITDISVISNLANLTLLDLGLTRISNISPVAGLTNLTELYLADNSITDIAPVSRLANLEKLSLSYNSITNISPVSRLTKLTYLNLAGNSIVDISPVAGLTNLTDLYLSSNNIVDISPVAGLTNLTDLYLHSNNIVDISSVAGLTNLTQLQLHKNSITDISPLVANTGLEDRIILVYLSGNPLSTESVNTHIPALRDREVTVSFEAAAAPPMAQTEGASVLGVSGSIVGQTAHLNQFRVTIKNLSSGKTIAGLTQDADGVGYQLEVEAGEVGNILLISAQSPDPSISVKLLRYTLTAEDVLRGWIQLPALVAYEIPQETELLANYPNPFNPETWIPYRLAEDADVKLTIYDSKGQAVRSLDVGHQGAGVYESRSRAVYFDGRNASGEPVSSGVYFYHLSAGDYSATRRMLILK